ncbi:hypothetical protein KTO58_08320 [Chitinophaga pendula]|uniref:hypothetical protein n=1 Tax=Chitinophaga TaxID=79328 RepID=UPI000BAFF93C|nr:MULTISPECIES: hypothetical protein [Chitinophaga]ASZ13203.1 hypothetical protein CK934_20685 [Chitinophaga sp. MD30]UCJ09176.1 hypothetical protein KTO58_08320 [Chitinophaga pendula]
MNMLFYYDEIYNAAVTRIKQIAGISVHRKNRLVNMLKENIPSFVVKPEDIDEVSTNTRNSIGLMLCPEALAEYAGISKLLEKDIDEGLVAS